MSPSKSAKITTLRKMNGEQLCQWIDIFWSDRDARINTFNSARRELAEWANVRTDEVDFDEEWFVIDGEPVAYFECKFVKREEVQPAFAPPVLEAAE